LLYGRAGDTAVGAIDAAIAFFGLQEGLAIFAGIEELTGLCGHGLFFLVSAVGAGDDGLQFDFQCF